MGFFPDPSHKQSVTKYFREQKSTIDKSEQYRQSPSGLHLPPFWQFPLLSVPLGPRRSDFGKTLRPLESDRGRCYCSDSATPRDERIYLRQMFERLGEKERERMEEERKKQQRYSTKNNSCCRKKTVREPAQIRKRKSGRSTFYPGETQHSNVGRARRRGPR